MKDPLYAMSPGDRFWWATMGEEVESLFVAIVQEDVERRDRKIAELRVAFEKLESQ